MMKLAGSNLCFSFLPVLVFIITINAFSTAALNFKIFQKPCVLHYVYISGGNESQYLQELSSTGSNIVLALLALQLNSRIEKVNHHDQLQNITLRAMNSKRSFTQSCYIQFLDVDSFFQLSTGSKNIKSHLNVLQKLLLKTVLPHFNLVQKELSVSPNFVFFSVTKNISESTEFDAIVELVWNAKYYGTSYFALVDKACCKILCVYCRTNFLHKISQNTIYTLEIQTTLQELKDVWDKFHKNLQGIKLRGAKLLQGHDKTNCDLRFYNRKGFRAAQSYPWSCVSWFISRRLNVSFLKEPNTTFPIHQRLNMTFHFDYQQDSFHNRRYYTYEKQKNTLNLVWEYFCTYYRPYRFKMFVHKNATRRNFYSSVLSTFHSKLSFLTGISIVVLVIVFFAAFQIRKFQTAGTKSFFNLIIFVSSPLINQVNNNFVTQCRNAGNLFKLGIILWLFVCMLISSLHCGKFLSLLTVKEMPRIPGNVRELVSHPELYSDIPILTTSGKLKNITHYLLQLIDQALNITDKDDEILLKSKHIYCKINSQLITESFYKPLNRHQLVTNITYSVDIPVRIHKCDFPSLHFTTTNFKFPAVVAVLDYTQDIQLFSKIFDYSGQFERIVGKPFKDDDSSIGHGNIILPYESKFMSSFIHRMLGWMDNSGLHQRWVNQFVDHLYLSDESYFKINYQNSSRLYYQNHWNGSRIETEREGLGLQEIWFVFEINIAICAVGLAVLLLEIMKPVVINLLESRARKGHTLSKKVSLKCWYLSCSCKVRAKYKNIPN